MAARSSHNEERNLLRIREWERRSQETIQDKEFYPENVPLFAEPYKTNKGDELSSRIQRMLGNYEDVNNPHPHQCLDSFAKDPPSHVAYGRSSHGRPSHTDKAKLPFQNPPQYGGTTQSGHPNSSHSSQPPKKLPAPDHHGPSSSYTKPSLGHSQGGSEGSPDTHQRKAEPWPDLRECASLPPVLSALSPPTEPLSPLHSSEPSDSEPQDTDDKETPERRRRRRGSPEHTESPITMELVSPLDPQRDTPLLASEGTTLPSQTFPPPLASKPSLVMPQKPTAYVRPMDGQDQVTSESPDLKPSPEDFHGQPYEPLPDLKSTKPSLSKLKIPSQSLETLSNEAHCVEDILREMTHSWPPLLTAIHTPSTAEPSKFSFPAKEAQHVPPAFPGQKHYGSPPTAPSSINQQSSSTVAAAHSSGVESASSSDSESSSGSESDSESSESGTEEVPQPLRSSPPVPKTEGPTVTNWQLNNWIRVSQQNPATESQSDPTAQSPVPKQQQAHPEEEEEDEEEEEEEGAVAHPTPRDYNSHTPTRRPEFSDGEAKPQRDAKHADNNNVVNQVVRPYKNHKYPAAPPSHGDGTQRKTVGNKHPSKPAKAPRPEDPQPAGLRVESVEVAPRDKDPSFTDRPKVKTKTSKSGVGGAKADGKKPAKRTSSEKRKAKEKESGSGGPKVTLVLDCKRDTDRGRSPSPGPVQLSQPSPALAPPPPVKTTSSVQTETVTVAQKGHKKPRSHSPAAASVTTHLLQSNSSSAKRGGESSSSAKASKAVPGPPPRGALVVKIELSLLSRVPLLATLRASGKRPPPLAKERGDPDTAAAAAAATTTKVCKKRPADKEAKAALPRKKPKLEKDLKPSSSSGQAASKSETSRNPRDDRERKRPKKAPHPPLQQQQQQQPPTSQEPPSKGPGHKHHSGKGPEPSTVVVVAAAGNGRDAPPVKHKKSTGKQRPQHSKTGKKAPKSSFAVPAPALPTVASSFSRPLLKFEDRQHPVEYHMKEAKKLKHKADATITADKVGKAINYLDAAMSFVESGIAMETDPQTPKSAYTMFAETVDLIRFILKLKNSMDPSSPTTEKDFTVLCMKCQSLLQMAMFRYKREAALKYSRTLTDHFKTSSKSAQAPSPCVSKSTGTPSPMSPMPSPASTASSSGPGSNHSGSVGSASSTVAIPQVIQQVASSYVNITSLFLSAHDIWEQADELAHRGSSLLSELDSALGPLSLTSSMSMLVRYTRQGLHWLRMDARASQ